MKRIQQLQALSKEHHQSLVLAQKAINAAGSNEQKIIDELCQQIVDSYPDDWAVHFKIEEDSIFKVVLKQYKNIAGDTDPDLKKIYDLCVQLEQEHRQMSRYYEQIKTGDQSVLGDFGRLLKQHTRTEERELFPLLENYFEDDMLQQIANTSQAYRQLK